MEDKRKRSEGFQTTRKLTPIYDFSRTITGRKSAESDLPREIRIGLFALFSLFAIGSLYFILSFTFGTVAGDSVPPENQTVIVPVSGGSDAAESGSGEMISTFRTADDSDSVTSKTPEIKISNRPGKSRMVSTGTGDPRDPEGSRTDLEGVAQIAADTGKLHPPAGETAAGVTGEAVPPSGVDLVENGLKYLKKGILLKSRDESEKANIEFFKAEDQYARTLASPTTSKAGEQALYYLGCLYFEKNDLEKALEYFNLAEKADPENLFTKYNLASIHFAMGDLDRALSLFEDIYKKDPDNSDVCFYLGLIYANRRLLEKATFYLRKAAELDPTDKEIHLKLGAVYQNQKDYDEAVKEYRRALVLDPENALACNQIGAVYYLKEDYERSIKWHKKAIEFDSDMIEGFYNLACAYQSAGDTDHARVYFCKVLELNPNFKEQKAIENFLKATEDKGK